MQQAQRWQEADNPLREMFVMCGQPPHARIAGIRIGGIVAFGILAGTLLLSFLPGWHGLACPIWLVYHVHCPGCGITRSLVEAWRGHFRLSFRYHPCGFPVFVCCVMLIVGGLLDGRSERASAQVRLTASRLLNPRVVVPVACLLIALWIARLLLEVKHNSLFLW